MRKLCNLIACIFLIVVTCPVHAAFQVSASSCVLYDPLTGAFLYEKNADVLRPIASTTKLMTAITVLSCASPDDTVTIPPEAVRVEGSRIYVKAGETLKVETLLYGLMLESGNDAAIALALHCDKSVEAFAQRMNELAADLQLNNTHFTNPHGLPDDDHVSTARDLALIMAAAVSDELLRTVMSTKTITLEGYRFNNHNKLLWRYAGTDGGKTGFTKLAGRCLCSTAQRNGRRLICVTLNAPDDWNDHISLYTALFDSLESCCIARSGEILANIPVAGGHGISAAAAAACDLNVYLYPQEAAEQKLRLLLPHHVYAPVRAGQTAGTAQVLLRDTVIAQFPLVISTDIARTENRRSLLQQFLSFFKP